MVIRFPIQRTDGWACPSACFSRFWFSSGIGMMY